ncbi:GNAT family N-acetyltransferase [Rhodospirillum rubrum]|uniref:GNAT family N-acetyltransferase n=1 Tax=Rhodospirillum rubrum TaxID=1085 RepID=UPI001907E643|nr:GNAT family N-acetyltransferase [Rhodospirillum rubrum]MBK1665181.1 GNAT family N-acetyltransferase [Rhodospirillum rubrum]MBK1677803.1 GNAT family N-acetyltransferase [Rhodospirillum rubrum]
MSLIELSSFAAFNDRFGAALNVGTIGGFFHSPEWFACLFAHGLEPADAGATPAIFVLDQDGPQAALFCLRRQNGTLRSLTSYYTTDFAASCPAGGGERAAIIEDLGRHLSQKLGRRGAPSLELRYLRADSSDLAALERGLRRPPLVHGRFAQWQNWYAPVEAGAYGAYAAARPSRLRHTLTRKKARLERQGTTTLRLHRTADAEALAAYEAVYGASWKPAEASPGFLRALAVTAAKAGALRLGVLHIDGAPAAAQIWLVSAGRATIYKLAHHPRFDDLSVGSLLTQALAEEVINRDGVSEIDFGLGDEPYKRDWMTAVRPVVGLEIHSPTTARGLIACARLGLGRLRRRLGR